MSTSETEAARQPPDGGAGPTYGHWSPAWHTQLDTELLNLAWLDDDVQSEVRRELAKDPVAFAVIYFSHHLKDQQGNMSFSGAHYEWASIALEWRPPHLTSTSQQGGGGQPQPRACRDAIIAPRECGKSTWWFLILPLWAACNGYKTFIAAFANAGAQAEAHLATMKLELENNALLARDFPLICTPAKKRSGGTVADRSGMMRSANGFVFAARGIDASVLGMKVDQRRPELLILDDIEPDESNYSPDMMIKRLSTVTDAIFPLNIYAAVAIIGTVTMPGSIMHQCVKAAVGVDVADWIADEQVRCHYIPPIITLPDGSEASVWPQKWPLEFLTAIRHTRSFAKNYANDPMARDGVYWVREDFRFGDLTGCTKTALFVDPAVTTKKASDFTGLAVVSFRPGRVESVPTGRRDPRGVPLVRQRIVEPAQVVVRESQGVKLTGRHLRAHVERLLERFPQIRLIHVESNQGGDLWSDVFAGIPSVTVSQHNSTASKEVRFAEALEHWQAGNVWHARRFGTLEEQAVGFPNAPYDDVIDAAAAGVRYFLGKPHAVPVKAREEIYV